MANAAVLACSGVLFDDNGRVLFHHHPRTGLWLLPGGAVEPDETPWLAVIRETREQVGLEVRVQRLASVVWRPHLDEMLFSFVVDLVGTAKTTSSDESDEAAWFTPAEIRDRVASRYQQRVEDARLTGPPRLRVEDPPE